MDNLFPATQQKGKLQGGEKYFGYFIGAAAIGALLYLMYFLFPIITTAITNTTDMIWAAFKLAATVTVTLGTIILIWKNRDMISYWYNILIKLTWKAMIEANPIAGMRYAYDKWLAQNEELNETITTLEAKKALLKGKMDKRRTEANSYFEAGLKAKELAENAEGEDASDLNETANSNAIMAQRRKESLDIFLPRIQLIDSALDFSKKLHKSWLRGLALLKDDIDIKEDDLSVLKSIAGAFETAKSIISGNTNERAIYEEAIVAYGKQVSDYVGKCKRFTEMAKDYAVNIDVQNAMDADKGQKYLEVYDAKAFAELTNFNKVLDASPSRQKLTMAQSANRLTKAMDTPATQVYTDFIQLP
jgi:hypothetical protein